MRGVVFVGLYAVILLLGLKEFSLWGQITDLSGSNPFELLTQGHPHALRYMLMDPVILIADGLGGRYDSVFTAGVFFIIVVNGVLMARLANELLNRRRHEWFVHFAPLFGVMAATSLVMNGRISISMLGITVIALAQARWMLKRISSATHLFALHSVGLWLASVSSGTFMVGLTMVFTFSLLMPVATLPTVRIRNVGLMGTGLALILIAAPIAILFVDKNVRFYGGGMTGLVGLLEHGAGNLLLKLSSTVLIAFSIAAIPTLIVFAAFLANARIRLRRGSPFPPLHVGVLVSLCLGVFGFSTMLVCLPIVTTLLYVKLLKDAPGLTQRQARLTPA